MKKIFFAIICVFVVSMTFAGCGNQNNLTCVSEDIQGEKPVPSTIENTFGVPVVMKVGRTTCIPCRQMSKLLGEMEPKLEGKAKIEIVDIDEDPDAVKRFNVTGIPVTIFFDVNGTEVYRQIGVLEEMEINEWLVVAGMKQ
jgi:thioredoxin 1